MISERKKSIAFLFLIAGRKQKADLLTFLLDLDAHLVNILYGKGSVKANASLVEVFGFLPEENKVIITCVISHENAEIVIDRLQKKFNFNKPNTGIAFTVNVDSLSF